MGWSETGSDRMCRLRCFIRNYGREKVIDLVNYRREQELVNAVSNLLYPELYPINIIEETKEFYSLYYNHEITDSEAERISEVCRSSARDHFEEFNSAEDTCNPGTAWEHIILKKRKASCMIEKTNQKSYPLWSSLFHFN